MRISILLRLLIIFFLFGFFLTKLNDVNAVTCAPPNMSIKIVPLNRQIFKRTNGSVNIGFSLNDGSNTGCYPHKGYFGVARGGTTFNSGWVSTLINNPYNSILWTKDFTEDGYYTYRGRTANNQNTMSPYDTNPYFFCIDTLPPTVPSGDNLICSYDTATQKFNINYRWQISTENGCAGFHSYPYWAQLSTYSDFRTAVNSNYWNNQTTTQASGISGGATIYAHVRSRDKADNPSGWTTTKLIPINCKNCSGCPAPTNTPTPRPTNTPIPTITPCLLPNMSIKIVPLNRQIFKRTNGSVNIGFSLNDGSNTGCYPHKGYFGVARGGTTFNSGWVSTLINNPYNSILWTKDFTEDGYYTYRGRTANNQNTMSPYDTNPYFFCIDTQPPTAPLGDSLICSYDSATQKFNVNYRWQLSTENGCAGLHSYPYWAQLSAYSDFRTAVNSNYWNNQTITQAMGITDGTTIYAHVRSRDKANNQSNWTTTKLIPINCKNCTGCPVPTPIPTNTPTPTLTPTPALVSPLCNGIASSYNASDNTIRTIFHFEGRNTSNVTLYPSCVYSENTATSWIGMTPITANVNPAKVGRPYPGQTTGDYICRSSPLTVGKTYKTMAQAIVFYDLNNNLGHDTGEPTLSTTCSSQPIVSGPTPTSIPTNTPTPIPTNTPTPIPTNTPTPTPALVSPLCSGIVSSYNASDNTIRTIFHFEGRNTSNVTLYPSCVYSENIATASWISMIPIVANVNPAKVGRPYPAQTTGDYTCKSGPLAVGKTYKTVAQAIVFYDLNKNLGRNTGEPALSTTCSSQPLVSVPLPTTIPTPTLSFPSCSNFTASQSNGIITASYNFQGINSSSSLLNTACYYAPVGSTNWLGMTGSSYRAGNESGIQTCNSAFINPGVYKVVASTYVFYDTNSNRAYDSAQELRKICTGNPDAPNPKNPVCNACLAEVTIPNPTPTPTLPLTPIVTYPDTSPAPECISGSCPSSKKNLGDANCDCIINSQDKEMWIQQYLNPPIGSKSADFDGNNIVDLKDYGIWRNNAIN